MRSKRMYCEPDYSIGWFGVLIFRFSKYFISVQTSIKTVFQLPRKIKNIRLFRNLTFLVVSIMLNCCTMSPDTYHGTQNPLYKESPQAPGFKVYTKPFLSDTETKKYFGVNLLKNSILALYISVTNTNQRKIYIITEESIKITRNIAGKTINSPGKGSEQAANIATGVGIGAMAGALGIAGTAFSVSYPAWVGSVAIITVPIVEHALPFYVEKKLSDASAIREHFETQKFRATTLEAGEKTSGFIYLNWNDLKGYNDFGLCLIITDALSNEMYYPCFDVSLQMRKGE